MQVMKLCFDLNSIALKSGQKSGISRLLATLSAIAKSGLLATFSKIAKSGLLATLSAIAKSGLLATLSKQILKVSYGMV